jgi:hypothetical protein
LPANQPSVTDPPDHGEREHDVPQAWTQDGHERNREQQAGEREQHVHDATDDLIDPAAVVPSDRSHRHADERRNTDDHQTNKQ